MTGFFTKFQIKYRNAISLNKDLLLSGIVGFIVSLIVAYMSARYFTDHFTKSALTVIAGFACAKVIFVILFHLDNRKKYTKISSGKLNIPVLKEIVKKMLFADSIFEVVDNVTRFFILLQLLRIEYPPVAAAAIASIIASSFAYLAINLVIKRLHVFSSKKRRL
jgi:putative flippase GtrA